MYNREQWLLILMPLWILVGFFFGIETATLGAILVYYLCYANDMKWSVWAFTWRSLLAMQILYFGTIYGEHYLRKWLSAPWSLG